MADQLITGTTLVETVKKVEIKPAGFSQPSFDETDLTIDTAWHSLDFSAIVPNGTEWLLIKLFMKASATTGYILLGENSSVGIIEGIIQVANQAVAYQKWVKLDSSGKLAYNVFSGGGITWADLNFTVIGYL